MVLTNTNNRDRLTANGVLVDFDFTFRVFNTAELAVYIVDTNSLATLQTEGVDYSVVLSTTTEGGTVTFTTAPTNNYEVLMLRSMDYGQTANIPTNEGFKETKIELGLDRLGAQIQQLKDQVDKAVQLPLTSAVSSITLPTPVDGKAILWDGTTGTMRNSIANIDDIDVAVIQGYATAAAASAAAAAQSAIDAANAAVGVAAVTLEFDNADLSSGVLTVTHNFALNAPYAIDVTVFDNNNKKIAPDEITGAANSIAVDLGSYGTISGTWAVIIGARGVVDIASQSEAEAGGNNVKLMTPLRVENHFQNKLLDEDNFASDSDIHVPTQQSTKAYVDAFKPTGLNISSQAEGDLLYFNGTSWVVLAIGAAGTALKVNSAADAPEWGNIDVLSNVVLDWGLADSEYSSGSYGIMRDTDTNAQIAAADALTAGWWYAATGTTYRDFAYGRFTKLAGIDTITIHARAWRYNGTSDSVSVQVDVGGQTGVASTSGASPGWTTATIDVSSLTNGTTYGITASLKSAGAGGEAHCSRLILIAS